MKELMGYLSKIVGLHPNTSYVDLLHPAILSDFNLPVE